MKKIFSLLIALFTFSSVASASVYDTLDIYEEYASSYDEECKAYEINIQAPTNTPKTSAFLFSGEGIYNAEITSFPKHGTLTVGEDAKGFTYTPDKDFVGNDCFYYRVSSSTISSNIAKCTILVEDNTLCSSYGFYYADMKNNSAEYASLKLVELDILKGERIGREYYFYPKAYVTRGMGISCLNRADKYRAENSTNVTTVFADSAALPSQMKNDAYKALNAGIINGVSKDGQYYLNLDQPVTKAEFICMIDRAMNQKTITDKTLAFADAALIPDFAKTSVKNLVSRNILSNEPGTFLNPNEPLTKEDMATLLYKFVKFEEQNSVKTMAQQIRQTLYFDKTI